MRLLRSESPDFNPLHYFVQSVIEECFNKFRHSNVTLVNAVIEVSVVFMEKKNVL